MKLLQFFVVIWIIKFASTVKDFVLFAGVSTGTLLDNRKVATVIQKNTVVLVTVCREVNSQKQCVAGINSGQIIVNIEYSLAIINLTNHENPPKIGDVPHNPSGKCKAVGWGSRFGIGNKLREIATDTVKVISGGKILFKIASDKENIYPTDIGGAIVCGQKLTAIIFKYHNLKEGVAYDARTLLKRIEEDLHFTTPSKVITMSTTTTKFGQEPIESTGNCITVFTFTIVLFLYVNFFFRLSDL